MSPTDRELAIAAKVFEYECDSWLVHAVYFLNIMKRHINRNYSSAFLREIIDLEAEVLREKYLLVLQR